MTEQTPKAPAHLRADTAAWWKSVVRDYILQPHKLRLLQAACEAWDRLQQAREILARDGLTVEGREGGIRPHPAVAIERDARIGFARLVRELDLADDDDEPRRGVGAPGLGGIGVTYETLQGLPPRRGRKQ